MKFSVEFDPFVVLPIFATVHLNEKKESEKQFSSVISHIWENKITSQRGVPTIWMDFTVHFWTNGTALFLTKKHGTNSKLSFDEKFQMQVISCVIKLNNRNHEWKNETQITKDQNLTSFSSRVLHVQMSCKKFVNNGNKNRTAVTS